MAVAIPPTMRRLGRACYGGPVSKSWFGWLGESDLSDEEYVPHTDPPVALARETPGAAPAAEALLYNTDRDLYEESGCAPSPSASCAACSAAGCVATRGLRAWACTHTRCISQKR